MYNFKNIEEKWQKYWDNNQTFKAYNGDEKPKYYVLIEFPYPSGVGLHIGHPRSYTALDSVARKRRLEGYNVLFPMGWDAFGLPAENYAIKNHIHPKDAVKENIKIFKNQCQKLGISFDWSREFSTTDPEYYKWTQWQFLKFYEHGLAYKAKKAINWCTSCKVGLSNEDVEHGRCERCGGEVVQKEKDQWMLRMSSYADKLIDGLDETEFVDRVKTAQINWIGKSEGAEIDFKLEDIDDSLKVYTTRPDTIYGVTFMVISPEHPFIEKFKDRIKNYSEVKSYQLKASKKSEFERIELTKEKTGVRLEGINVINPLNNEKIELWTSDYVMMGYGTGAIMAVPAHDERDYDFAKKFNIPIVQVIAPSVVATDNAPRTDVPNTKRKIVCAIIKHHTEDKYLVVDWKVQGWKSFVAGGIEENESIEDAVIREVKEETGYQNIVVDKISNFYFLDSFYASHKNVNREVTEYIAYVHIKDDIKKDIDPQELEQQTPLWLDKDEVLSFINKPNEEIKNWIFPEEKAWTEDGVMINSGILNGIDNKKDSIAKMIYYLEEKGIGKKTSNYRLQDWVFSRQRFWGEPIPMIYCEKCGWVPVPESDLPILLPEVASYETTDDGESPLASMPEWYKVACPKCGEDARRETDTMPNWAGSSWYWLRYMDPNNDKEFVSQDALRYWGMVDWYNGGMEHATRHLLYARFWHRFLYDIGLVPTSEPFLKRTAHGMILGEDGTKISKSKGNGINPNEIVAEYGADALRAYEMFIGDYETDTAWSLNGLKGCKRFLDRLWRIQDKVVAGDNYSKELEISIHKTIKKVSNDLEVLKFNTAISALMTLLNEYEARPNITKEDLRVFLTLLNPIAPHITEEINELQQLGKPLCQSSWPIYDESKTVEDTYELVIQVNGKVRGREMVSNDITDEEMKDIALKNETVSKFTFGYTIVKVITVPKKLINIVVK